MTAIDKPTIDSGELYAAASFDEFWEHYQRLHAEPRTRGLHAVATASAIGLLALAIARRSKKIALIAPIVDYSIAQISHRRFDGVKTKPYRRPLWHARAEWRLFRRSLARSGLPGRDQFGETRAVVDVIDDDANIRDRR